MNKSVRGFTIVELLIVIVVIAILAAVSIVACNGVQERSRSSKIKTDVAAITKAATASKNLTNKTLVELTTTSGIGSNNTGTGRACWSRANGSDLSTVARTDKCWTDYFETLQIMTDITGINVTGLIDPYGRPYYIDQSEGENVSGNLCVKDKIGAYQNPFVSGSANDDSKFRVLLPNITSGC